MKLPLFIASRYLVSRKKRHLINIISGISVLGVMIGTFALIVILSVFNGFDELVQSLFSAFDPELKVVPASGKRFSADSATIHIIKTADGVKAYSRTIEENVLLQYNDKTHPAKLKAVDNNYWDVTGVDSMIIDRAIENPREDVFCVVGQGLAYQLGINLNIIRGLVFYAPRRDAGKNIQAHNAFRKDYLIPTEVFSIRQELDAKYVIVPLSFAQKLYQIDNEVSSIEIKMTEGYDMNVVKHRLQANLGDDFIVKNRYELHEFFYKVMQSEKWAIFLILSFILVIASFNIIGSLTMLIIDKKNDVKILESMGANHQLINRIFISEGIMITAVGAVSGLFLGFVTAWLQQTYGLIKIDTSGTLIIDAYPVQMKMVDFIWVIAVVGLIGVFASYFPVKYLTRRILR